LVKSGLKVSALSFGSWVTFGTQIGVDEAYKLMKIAYDAGINFFDNAEVYAAGESEIIMGKVLKKAGWKRSDLVVSTKIFWGGKGPNDTGLSRKHIIEGTDAALKRLQLDYVDLVFCHRPDIYTPMEETVWAMNHLIQQGRAFYWGTSEWSAEQIRDAWHIARHNRLIPPLMEQPEYNMFNREKLEREYLPLFRETGLGTTIWSPLASGVLTNKYAKGIPEGSRLSLEEYNWLKRRFETTEGKDKLKKAEKLNKLAEKLGISLAEMSIAWCLKNENVSTVILGATRETQLMENLKSQDAVKLLTHQVMEEIESILGNKPATEKDWRG